MKEKKESEKNDIKKATIKKSEAKKTLSQIAKEKKAKAAERAKIKLERFQSFLSNSDNFNRFGTMKLPDYEEEDLLAEHKKLKLQIELVPSSCFYSNVRSLIKISQWDKIRKVVYERANFKCEICGDIGNKHPVECHEVWEYDDELLVQNLSFFQALCPFCHEVKHIGFASVLGNQKRAFDRFMSFNKLKMLPAKKMEGVIFREHAKRSSQNWKMNIDHLSEWGLDVEALNEKIIKERTSNKSSTTETQ